MRQAYLVRIVEYIAIRFRQVHFGTGGVGDEQLGQRTFFSDERDDSRLFIAGSIFCVVIGGWLL